MHVGYAAVFQNPGRHVSDREVYINDLRFAEMAEPMGFESIWSVEHHFTDYTMCPDVVQFLSYMAGKTKTAKLGSMVVVLPWHDPIRVAEQISMLDHLSGGRMVLGIGRGLGRVEFDGFRLDMNKSRGQFTEYAEMILEGLESGYLECDGEYVKQPRREIRPKPFKSFRGRTYAAAVSPESMPIMAKLGVGILVIPQKPWSHVEEDFRIYRALYRDLNGEDAPPPIAAGWVFVDGNAERAEEMARTYIGKYFESVIKHYEFTSEHLKQVAGYEYYAHGGIFDKVGEAGGAEKATDFFVGLMPWGTPEQVYEKITVINERLAIGGFIGVFSYAGMPWDAARGSMELFAKSVLPELNKIQVQEPQFSLTA